MLLNIVLVSSFLLCASAIDKTLEPETKGVDVVCDVINKIDKSLIFADDERMLRRIAYVESRFGDDEDTYRRGYHGGIWQVDEMAFDDIMINGSYPNLDQIWPKIEQLLSKEKKDIKWEDLRIPLFSGVFARIRLYLVKDTLPASNKLEAQAKYWKDYYNCKGKEAVFVQRVKVMNKEFGSDCNMCKGRMNFAFIMDGSGSIGSQNYLYAKHFAINLIDTFSNVTADVGYVLFSDSVEVIFPLKSNLTRDQMKKKIDESGYPAGSTQTHRGIDEGVTILAKADNDTGIPKAMAIFTDGNPDDARLAISAANQAKKSNITIFAIGIGDNIDENNLKSMASQESYVIPVASYESLIQITDKINSKTCSVPQTPDIESEVKNDQLDKYEKRYFSFQIQITGLRIKVDNSKGKTQGYYSYTYENPSSAIYDGEFTKESFITKGDAGNASSVYVTIQGQEDNNIYSLKTSGGNQLKTSMLYIVTSFILFTNFFSF